MRLEGKITDFGDLIHQERWIVKGRRFLWRWKVGPVDKVHHAQPRDPRLTTVTSLPAERLDLKMDLRADQKVTLSGEWTDEVGNPTTTPDGATVVYTVDNATVIDLTDNGDGTAVAAATGTLGTANIHAVATADGVELTGDLQIVVVAGLAERFTVVAGEPEEVTPDETTPPTP